MRTITKTADPQALVSWKQQNQVTPQNLIYGGGGFPGDEVRKALLLEQKHLCAYTMKQLKTAAECPDQDTTYACHIEHLLPQARKIPAETIDFQNMVACYPPSRANTACEFGAVVKGDYDPSVKPFVSPLQQSAESHFSFDKHGKITGLTPEGRETIKALRLDHSTLNNDRAAAVKGRLEPKRGKTISAATARRLAQEILQPDAQQKLPPFCVAIAQVALQHAEREERRAARMKKKTAL